VSRRAFRRASGDERRAQLIGATLDCVAEGGLQAATVRAVAERAGVTGGLIRHYFATKDQMIHAAYRETIAGMTEMAKAAVADLEHAPRERLAGFVRANLTPPVVDPRTQSLWAAFVSLIRTDPEMAAIHREGYLAFRGELEHLVAGLFAGEGRPIGKDEAVRHAIRINAVIDGLWLEGCMAGEMFADDELAETGIAAVEAILGIELERRRPD
jgi:AcrR family transcriptional regulator